MFTAKIRIALLLLISTCLGFAENLPLVITNAAEAQAEGQSLVREVLSARPEANATLSGWINIRTATGVRIRTPVKFETLVSATNWTTVYEASSSTNYPVARRLAIEHSSGSPNRYEMKFDDGSGVASLSLDGTTNRFSKTGTPDLCRMGILFHVHSATKGAETMYPFIYDFWLCDLGLEFFHWPEQRVIRKEIRRSRSCKVLESINPQPATNAYSKVISWIDRESHGIVYAEAYDAGGKLLKEFEPRRFRKVEGQWQLQEMEIRNVQTGSRTRIEFDAPAE